jgi:ABC-type proline/glycine betaine transport system substrate-binding protein
MTRISTAGLAVITLLALAGCGSDSGSTPVDGPTVGTGTTTVPATTATTSTATTATTATGLPPEIDAAAQLAILKDCVGGKPADTFKWFQPTLDYAASLGKGGGGGFTVVLDGKPMTLVVFPYVQAAQYGFKDIQDRLIALQQKRPTDYATVAATAAQPIGNVLEVATQGAVSEKATQTINACIAKSST